MKPRYKYAALFGQGRMVIRPKTHAFTILSLSWTFFSVLGLFFFLEYRRRHTTAADLIAALLIWGLHLVFVGLAVYFSHTEKPRKVTVLKGIAGIGL
jgi:hypothetical protein